MSNEYPTFPEINEQRNILREMELRRWLHHDLGSFNWWLMLGLTLLAWWLWVKTVDRSRLLEIIFYGSMVVIVSLVLDVAGVHLMLWGYPSKFDPTDPAFVPIDLVMLPVSYMLVYQRFGRHVGVFFFASLVTAAIMSFVLEPILVYLQIYQLLKWKHHYSFPIYTGMALVLRCFVHKVMQHQTAPTK